tara:strand:- start:3449 stop:3796 length:348 start_codon:yes stop_codon:yes gene_type:complete
MRFKTSKVDQDDTKGMELISSHITNNAMDDLCLAFYLEGDTKWGRSAAEAVQNFGFPPLERVKPTLIENIHTAFQNSSIPKHVEHRRLISQIAYPFSLEKHEVESILAQYSVQKD